MKKGQIYIFTGDGKGKTTAALGVVVRAMGHKMKVGWVSWYKEEVWPIGELKLKGKIKMYMLGKGFYKLPTDKASFRQHKGAANAALKKARDLMSGVDLLILDEINNAVNDKLISLSDLIELISMRGKTHLILTGRGADKKLIEMADLVSECRKIKHPFDKGIKAVKGLDY